MLLLVWHYRTLSVLKSSVRKSPLLKEDEYQRTTDGEDIRFVDYYGTIQPVVTSNAQNDNGLFETNFRDERFLSFEGHGVESTWKIELPAEFRQFDYDTISDVILHIRCTARQGGALLGQGAVTNLEEKIETTGLTKLFSIRHEFPTAWASFKSKDNNGATVPLRFEIREDHFPYWSKGRLNSIKDFELITLNDTGPVFETLNGSLGTITTNKNNKEEKKISKGSSDKIIIPQSKNPFVLKFDLLRENSVENLWLAITWSSDN